MNIKTGIAAACVLGALVLIPVVVIVALGFYGESIGGGGSAGARAELSVSPNRGVPDSHVRIEGRKWPPRVEVKVLLGRDGAAGSERATELPLASVLSSRNGTFAVELALPASFVSRNTKRLSIRAEAVRRDGRWLSSDPVEFTIEPYRNAVGVQVRDANTGTPLEGANVRLKDSFGREVEVRSSDASGIVQFAGMMPGDAVIEASKVDYKRARIDLSAPGSGTVKASVSLTADPGKRLLLPFSETVPDGRVRVAAIDRASGLRADRIFEEDLTVRRTFPSEIRFFHMFPVSYAGKTAAPPSVETMRDWGHRLAARLPSIVAKARLLGMSANGDVVVVAEASGAGFGRGMARWFLLDAQTGRAKTRGEIGEGRFVGGLSLDRNSIYVVDNIENRLEMVPVERGEAAASVDRIPARVLRISPRSGELCRLSPGGRDGKSVSRRSRHAPGVGSHRERARRNLVIHGRDGQPAVRRGEPFEDNDRRQRSRRLAVGGDRAAARPRRLDLGGPGRTLHVRGREIRRRGAGAQLGISPDRRAPSGAGPGHSKLGGRLMTGKSIDFLSEAD